MSIVANLGAWLVPSRMQHPSPIDPSRTMRAARYARHGPPEVLHVEDVPAPGAGPGQVLVRVHAAGLNPVDAKMRRHHIARALFPLPKIPGTDLAGEVVQAPEGGPFPVGTRVFVHPDGVGMRALAGFLASGSVRAEVAHTLPLDDVVAAHRLTETGRAGGRIVLSI